MTAGQRPVRGHDFTEEYVDGRLDTTCACGWESTGHETFREAITAEDMHLAVAIDPMNEACALIEEARRLEADARAALSDASYKLVRADNCRRRVAALWEQLTAGRTQSEIVRVTGFTRETIRKISKETNNE